MSQDNDRIISIEDLRRKLVSRQSESSRQVSSTSIYRVPIEMSMPKSLFEPCLVALGPFHHRNPKLQAMEAYKVRLAQRFFRRGEAAIGLYITRIQEIEGYLRAQYDVENLPDFGSEEFVAMMLIDGAFLIEFLIRFNDEEWEHIDRMPRKRWTLLVLDIILLENQLPMLLLEQLYDITQLGPSPNQDLYLYIITFLHKSEFSPFIGHIPDLPELLRASTLIRLFPMLMEFPIRNHRNKTSLTLPSSPTISQLHRAGVEFRQIPQPYRQIFFQNGILEIPTLTIDENTEKLFANLLAYEVSNGEVHSVSDYVAMMDFLIDGPEDIRILVKYGIIENFLKDDEAASNLVNDLGRNIAIHDDFEFSYLVDNLNIHCRSSSAKWRAEFLEWKRDLKQNYIGSPWKFLSVVAAIILLVLTVIQTVCSILQLK